MNLSGNDKNKITGKKYQPVMSITGLNDQGLRYSTMARTEYVMFFPKVEIPEVPESAYSNILKHGRALSSEISNFQKPIPFYLTV